MRVWAVLGLVVGALLSPCLSELCPALEKEQELPKSFGSASVLVVHPIANYVVVATTKGNVLKVDKESLAVVKRLDMFQTSFTAGILWSEQDTLFLATQGFPAQLFRISLSTFEVVQTLTMEFSEPHISALLLVPPTLEHRSALLVASVRAVPSKVVTFDISGGAISRTATISLFSEENFAQGVTYNTYTQKVVALTDSVPPHIVEFTRTSNNSLSRTIPFPDTPLPIAPHLASEKHSELLDVSMVCHSGAHGDRIFVGTGTAILRLNTTHTTEERARAHDLTAEHYLTSPAMLARASLNAGHTRSRACSHDALIQRLYVATERGVLVYDTKLEPFGHKSTGAALCDVDVGELLGASVVAEDKFRARLFAVGVGKEERTIVYRLHAIAPPRLTAIVPQTVAAQSKRTVTLQGINLTDMFGKTLRVAFARVVSGGGPGETVVAETTEREIDVQFSSENSMQFTLPEFLDAGTFVVTVKELNGALVSNEMIFNVYKNPTPSDVMPKVVRAGGGTLMTVTGKGFFDTHGATQMKFICDGVHHIVNATFLSPTQITARSPAVDAGCVATVKVSPNGLDWLEQSAGRVLFVEVELTSIDPPVMLLRGDEAFELKAKGLAETDDAYVLFKLKSISPRNSDGNAITTPVYFDDSLQTIRGKTKLFPSTGLYTADLFFSDTKVSDSKILVEVINMTLHSLSPATVTTVGGVDVTVMGVGLPKHHQLTAVIVPAKPSPDSQEIELGTEVNDDGTEATFRLPPLPPTTYTISLRTTANANPVSLPHHLTVHTPLPFSVSHSPVCVPHGAKSHVIFSVHSASTLRQQLQTLFGTSGPAPHVSAKCVSTAAPAMATVREVELSSFFVSIDGVVTASSVHVVEEGGLVEEGGEVPYLNMTATFKKEGKSYACFISTNGKEWVRATGEIFSFSFIPQTIQPTAGPAKGHTAVAIQGTGHIKQCGAPVVPLVRFNKHNPGRTADSWSQIATARIIDTTTLALDTPQVPGSGVVTVDVSIDGVSWESMPLALPTDNYVFYDAKIQSVFPLLGPDTGGTRVELKGTGFPDTSSISVKFGDSRTVEAKWESDTTLSLTLPTLPPTAALPLSITFNQFNWQEISTPTAFMVYHSIEEQQLGLTPIAGSSVGGTKVSLTIVHGVELERKQLQVKFQCADGVSATVAVGTGDNDQAVIGNDGDRTLATYTFNTPVLGDGKHACDASVEVARNGVDFKATGHRFRFYSVAEEITFSPPVLVQGQETLISGSGFVDTEDELLIRFLNANTPDSATFVSHALTYNDDTQLTVQIPDLSSLFPSRLEEPKVRMIISFNGMDWLEVGEALFEPPKSQ